MAALRRRRRAFRNVAVLWAALRYARFSLVELVIVTVAVLLGTAASVGAGTAAGARATTWIDGEERRRLRR